MIKFNNVNLKTSSIKGKYPVNFENKLTLLLKKIKNRAEYEISDSHYYRSIDEHIANPEKSLYCRSIAFSISQDEANSAHHLLEVSMLHPSMMTEVKRPLAAGSKEDILKFLNSKESIKNIQEDILQMSEKLQIQ